MEESNLSATSDEILLARKSWTAYVGIVVLGLVLLLVAVPAVWQSSPLAGAVALGVILVVVGYKVLVLYSYRLYANREGVWVYSGVLPWTKGTRGVKWRDLDEAVYFTGFWSWLFKSYTIRIGHRFTKSSEIVLSHMARGHQSVMEINARHQQLVRANALS